ncbi:hypothetical protein QM467_01440 [Rhodoblastus sp. 17X3]|uniref:hypothetical protein n=1 Tax=Rhodoblastus sp. 17X3 TaxID=3047026 RepID=UPI0024B66B5C|nr:hypothetical protein [Rhodoblastus sp. 17X3]MDI9846717.1 hypothetical protein [Rhodoblastus sp. 17X3]
MTGEELIEQVRLSITVAGSSPPTDRAVAEHLGISVAGLAIWRARESVTARHMARLLRSVARASKRRTQSEAILPVVEFFQIQRVIVGNGGTFRIFNAGKGDDEHPYLSGLKRELETHRGVYIFYDSRGRALYVGKAKVQHLWKEINLAYNRDRDPRLQSILRVQHPERRQDFRTSDETRRQIRPINVRLHELAEYVSAYQVADEMIGDIESLLIRAFPNDLLNKKIENLTWD